MKQGLWFGLMFLILGGPVQAQSDFLGHLGHVVDNADLLTDRRGTPNLTRGA